MNEAILNRSQRLDIMTDILNSRGEPAALQGLPTWSIDNPTLGTLTPTSDGRGAQLRTLGVLGQTTGRMRVVADNADGNGMNASTHRFAIEVTEVGVRVVFNFSQPVPIDG